MLNSNHPEDERLSTLASGDTDATADAALIGHVSTCDRCTDLVNELGALRASLADLPDLRPSRPLRLLPEVERAPAPVDRVGGWARRFFAPVLTAGAALAMVGLVGTAAPGLGGMAQSAGGDAASTDATTFIGAPPAAEASAGASAAAGAALEAAEASDGSERAAEDADTFLDASAAAEAPGAASGDRTVGAPDESDEDGDALTQLPAERSPWPMVLFAGVALMVAAGLLRWILVPRAG